MQVLLHQSSTHTLYRYYSTCNHISYQRGPLYTARPSTLLCRVPPGKAMLVWPEHTLQLALPDSNVCVCALTVAVLIRIPAAAQSSFQLTLPEPEPSVRARYTWTPRGHREVTERLHTGSHEASINHSINQRLGARLLMFR